MDGMSADASINGALDFARDIAELAAEVDRTAAFPSQSLDILHYEKVLGTTARVEDGGQNAGLVRASDQPDAAFIAAGRLKLGQ